MPADGGAGAAGAGAGPDAGRPPAGPQVVVRSHYALQESQKMNGSANFQQWKFLMEELLYESGLVKCAISANGQYDDNEDNLSRAAR